MLNKFFAAALFALVKVFQLTYSFKLEYEQINAISTVFKGAKPGNFIDPNSVMKFLKQNAIGVLCNAKYKLNPGDTFYQSQQKFCEQTKNGIKMEKTAETMKEIVLTTKIDKKMFDQNAILKKIEKDAILSDENKKKVAKLMSFASKGIEVLVDLIQAQKFHQNSIRRIKRGVVEDHLDLRRRFGAETPKAAEWHVEATIKHGGDGAHDADEKHAEIVESEDDKKCDEGEKHEETVECEDDRDRDEAKKHEEIVESKEDGEHDEGKKREDIVETEDDRDRDEAKKQEEIVESKDDGEHEEGKKHEDIVESEDDRDRDEAKKHEEIEESEGDGENDEAKKHEEIEESEGDRTSDEDETHEEVPTKAAARIACIFSTFFSLAFAALLMASSFLYVIGDDPRALLNLTDLSFLFFMCIPYAYFSCFYELVPRI